MNKRQAIDWARTCATLNTLGFDDSEIESLRRVQMTLHRWQERECNGEFERDDNGKFYQYYGNRKYCTVIPNRETRALKRLAKIMHGKQGVQAYVQGDPRGCALYIVRDSDVPEGRDIESYYSRGIAVCY